MSPNRLLLIALGGETTLALVALVWIELRRLPLELGSPWRGLAAGTAAAARVCPHEFLPAAPCAGRGRRAIDPPIVL